MYIGCGTLIKMLEEFSWQGESREGLIMPLSITFRASHTAVPKALPPQAHDMACQTVLADGAGHTAHAAHPPFGCHCAPEQGPSPRSSEQAKTDAEQQVSQGSKLNIHSPSSPACLTTPQHACLACLSNRHFLLLMG